MILPWLAALLGGLTGWFLNDYFNRKKIDEKNTLLSEHQAQSRIMQDGLTSKHEELTTKTAKLEAELSDLRAKNYDQKVQIEELKGEISSAKVIQSDEVIGQPLPIAQMNEQNDDTDEIVDIDDSAHIASISRSLNVVDQDIEMLNDDIFREDYDELVDYEERIAGLNLQNVRLQKDLKKKSKKYKKLRTRYNELAIQYNKKLDQIKILKQSIVDNSAVKTIPIEITKEIEVVEKIDFKKLKKILGDKLPTIRSKKIKKASMVKGKPEVQDLDPDKKKKD